MPRRSRTHSNSDTLRRVEAVGNKVNALVYRCLVFVEGTAAHDEAFNGLCSCCWVAKGNLYAASESEDGSVVAATEQFIGDALRAYLADCRKASHREIERRALAADYRHAARVVRNKLRDHVRETYRAIQARKILDLPSSPEPNEQDMVAIRESLWDQQQHLIAAVGAPAYRTLMVAAGVWPLEKTWRRRKAQVTRAIAAAQGVTLQQARAHRRQLLRVVEGSTDPSVIAIRSSRWFFGLFLGASIIFPKQTADSVTA